MIIRYFEWALTHPDRTFPVWEELLTGEETGTIISREEALEIIKEQGYVCVHSCIDGQVYDHPSEEYKNNYYQSI